MTDRSVETPAEAGQAEAGQAEAAEGEAGRGEPRFVLEPARRWSESVLWRIQRNYFDHEGVDAWRKGLIPHYVTSNPYIARAYTRLVRGYLRDWLAAPRKATLDLKQPVYIVELGAGSGRFSFHFLKTFFDSYADSPFSHVPVRYVMTDFVGRNLDFWRTHPSLAPFVAAGQLDFARFDADAPEALRLEVSGQELSRETVANPAVVIANYLFDAIPHDAFSLEAGQLYELQTVVLAPEPDLDVTDPQVLKQVTVSYDRQPARLPYYADPVLDSILADYQARLADTAFLMPVGAFRCLDFFNTVTQGRVLLLSADRGHNREETLIEQPGPAIGFHDGCFSVMVNFHALGRWVEANGGRCWHPAGQHASLSVSAFLLGPARPWPETHLAYSEAVQQGGPDEYFLVKTALERDYAQFSLEQLLALLRLSGWDASVALGALPRLVELLAEAPEPLERETYWAIRQVWENYYPLGEDIDLAFHLAMLPYGIGYFPDALEFLKHSLRQYGSDPATLYNMGMCYYRLRQLPLALDYMDQALALDPTFEGAKGLRLRLTSEMQREQHPASAA